MKTITTTDAGRLLHRSGNTLKIRDTLIKHGLSPVYEHRTPAGYVSQLWDEAKVRELAAKIAPPPRIAAQKEPVIEDEVLAGLAKRVDGQSGYLCRIGESQAQTRNEISTVQAQQRLILEGLNRLLTAAKLQPVPTVRPQGNL